MSAQQIRSSLCSLVTLAGLILTSTELSAAPPASDEERLAIMTAQSILREFKDAKGEERHKLATEALTNLFPLLENPDQDDLNVWQLAGICGVGTQDAQLCAYAFDAVKRLRAKYFDDPSLADLMVQLNRSADK